MEVNAIEFFLVAGLAGYLCYKIFGDDSSERAAKEAQKKAAAAATAAEEYKKRVMRQNKPVDESGPDWLYED